MFDNAKYYKHNIGSATKKLEREVQYIRVGVKFQILSEARNVLFLQRFWFFSISVPKNYIRRRDPVITYLPCIW